MGALLGPLRMQIFTERERGLHWDALSTMSSVNAWPFVNHATSRWWTEPGVFDRWSNPTYSREAHPGVTSFQSALQTRSNTNKALWLWVPNKWGFGLWKLLRGPVCTHQRQEKPSPSHWHRKLMANTAVRLDKPCVSTWTWASLLSRFLVTAAWKLTGCWSPLVLFRVSSANFNSGYIHILLCQLPGNSWGMAPSVFSF